MDLIAGFTPLSLPVLHYFMGRTWATSWFKLVKKGRRHPTFKFELVRVGSVSSATVSRDSEVIRRTREEEVVREKRTDEISLQSQLYIDLAKQSPLLGVGPFGQRDYHLVAMLLAVAANASSLLPAAIVLASYGILTEERIYIHRSADLEYRAGLQFASVILSHVLHIARPDSAQRDMARYEEELRAPRNGPSLLHHVRDYIAAAVPHTLEVYTRDLGHYGFFGEPRPTREENANWYLGLANKQARLRRRVAVTWSPPLNGAILGCVKPFEASMLDVYDVQRHFSSSLGEPANSPPAPLYSPPSDPYFVNARRPEAPPTHVFDDDDDRSQAPPAYR
ncbi:hypothetical protein JCM8547_002509 [Rhodosporidiobolus lusitaniae]